MLKYILKRLGQTLLILIGVSLIIYFLVRLMPIDFVLTKVQAMNQKGSLSEEDIRMIYESYGLGDNSFFGIVKGYVVWLFDAVTGNFGKSFLYGIPVVQVISKYMGTSFAIAAIAIVFEYLIAIPLGVTAATHQYSIRDYAVTVFVMVGISLPSFFFGQILKKFFGVGGGWLEWFPIGGTIDANSSATGLLDIADRLPHGASHHGHGGALHRRHDALHAHQHARSAQFRLYPHGACERAFGDESHL